MSRSPWGFSWLFLYPGLAFPGNTPAYDPKAAGKLVHTVVLTGAPLDFHLQLVQ